MTPLTPIAPIALTMGEPAGIGAEIALKSWMERSRRKLPTFFLIDDPDRLRALARKLKLDIPVKEIQSPEAADKTFDEALPVLAEPLVAKVKPGVPNVANAPCVMRSIERAVQFALEGRAGAVVTNPIHKATLHQGGFDFPGHTEFLGHLAGTKDAPVMMLASPELRVVLASVHLSLREATQNLTASAIEHVARVTNDALKRDFAIAQPRIWVAGLNPHAGEAGSMGSEETTIIAPAIARLKSEGLHIEGPKPPDTLFTKDARGHYDVALCMYHDQGLIPLKTIGFDQGVNITLGLSFVRTSPDHGTAFDIAGQGVARPDSLCTAILTAAQMHTARTANDESAAR